MQIYLLIKWLSRTKISIKLFMFATPSRSACFNILLESPAWEDNFLRTGRLTKRITLYVANPQLAEITKKTVRCWRCVPETSVVTWTILMFDAVVLSGAWSRWWLIPSMFGCISWRTGPPPWPLLPSDSAKWNAFSLPTMSMVLPSLVLTTVQYC